MASRYYNEDGSVRAMHNTRGPVGGCQSFSVMGWGTTTKDAPTERSESMDSLSSSLKQPLKVLAKAGNRTDHLDTMRSRPCVAGRLGGWGCGRAQPPQQRRRPQVPALLSCHA